MDQTPKRAVIHVRRKEGENAGEKGVMGGERSGRRAGRRKHTPRGSRKENPVEAGGEQLSSVVHPNNDIIYTLYFSKREILSRKNGCAT